MKSRILLTILLFGLILRLTAIFIIPDRIIQGDAAGYENCALDILSGKGLPRTATRPPLYPLFLSGVYLLFGHNVLSASIVQSIISTITIFLVYLLTKEIFQKEKIALLASFLTAIDPFLVYFTGNITSETLFTFFLIFFLLFLQQSLNPGKSRHYSVFAGIICGIALLTRAVLLGFIILLPLCLLFLKPFKEYTVRIGLVLLGVVIILLPWTLRNYKIYHRFIPGTIQAGWNMWEAMNPKPYDISATQQWIESMNQETKGMNELERDNYFLQKTINYAKQNLKEFSISTVKKFFRFWRFYPYDPYPKKYKIISVAFFGPLLFLSVVGIIFTSPVYQKILILYLLLFYSFLSSLVFCPAIRYRLHLHPVLAIFTAFAIFYVLQRKVAAKSSFLSIFYD